MFVFNTSTTEAASNSMEDFNIMPIFVKILGVIMYILICMGNVSVIGISHYEKFGQDPQKRSFQDQIFGFSCLMFACCSFIAITLLEIRSLFGPIGNIPTLIYYMLQSMLLGIPMALAESILFRVLLIYFWRRFAAIDDDFFATFFNLFNFLIIGVGITTYRLMIGEFHQRYDYGTLSGIEIVDLDAYV